jgi:hypothetical protein
LVVADEFPLMVDVWEEMFGIDIEESPQIGLVDISEKEGIWFDMSQLNLDDPKKHSENNLEALQTWVDQIMAGTISLDGGYYKLLSQNMMRTALSDDDDDDEPPPPPPKGGAGGKKGKKEL